MYKTAQFKIRLLGDTTLWEDLPVAHIEVIDVMSLQEDLKDHADGLAFGLLDTLTEAIEIRWNWAGGSQGYYAFNGMDIEEVMVWEGLYVR